MRKGISTSLISSSVKFVSLHVLVFNEIENYRKVLRYYFSCKWPYFVIFWFFCIFWYVIVTSS